MLSNDTINTLLVDKFLTKDADVLREYFSRYRPNASLIDSVVSLMVFGINNYKVIDRSGRNGETKIVSRITVIRDSLKGGYKTLTPKGGNLLDKDSYRLALNVISKTEWCFDKPSAAHFIGVLVDFYRNLETMMFGGLVGDQAFVNLKLTITRSKNGSYSYFVKEDKND